MTDICVICQEDLCGNIYELPECTHKYHTNCIMHWFRANHNNCPLCQNQGINYNEAYKLANESNFYERTCWQQYYKKAVSYSRKKNANTEIIKKIK